MILRRAEPPHLAPPSDRGLSFSLLDLGSLYDAEQLESLRGWLLRWSRSLADCGSREFASVDHELAALRRETYSGVVNGTFRQGGSRL